MAGDPDKERLIAEIAAARASISTAGHALEQASAELKQKLDIPKRAGANYRRHTAVWLAGASLFGFLLSRIPARKKVVYVERSSGKKLGPAGKLGATWGFVKMAAMLAKPLLSTLATQRLADLAQRFTGAPGTPEDGKKDAERQQG